MRFVVLTKEPFAFGKGTGIRATCIKELPQTGILTYLRDETEQGEKLWVPG